MLKRRRQRSAARIASALLASMLLSVAARAQVRLIVGPTPIERGNAHSAKDITVVNEHLAFAIAVESAMPYGVPRGAIIDMAPVRSGHIGRDRVVFADFIPNDWSAWPNTYQKLSVLEQSAQRVRIRCERDWGKVRISTEYTLAAGADAVDIVTTMTNEGDVPLNDLLSGLTLWANSGHFFSVPGLAGIPKGPADKALSDRVTAYDEDWSITLHAPYLDHIGSDGLDLFRRHSLAPGQTQRFEGQLQVGTRGDLAPVMQAEITRRGLPSGTAHGRVLAHDGRPVQSPVIMIEKQGEPFGWILGADGAYTARLPAGDYQAYAVAAGYSQSPKVKVHIAADSQQTLDFQNLQPPATLQLAVVDSRDGAPLDARISIVAGQRNVVGFLGRPVFFTDLQPAGVARLAMAPGRYSLRIDSGGGFVTPSTTLEVALEPGKRATYRAALTRRFQPRQQGWYAADLHHHADQAEAVSPPEDVARSELAAGLDLLFVSDHDSTVNHLPLQRVATARGMPFLPGMEISPSWGHFNAYPLRLGEPLGIDTAVAGIDAVLAEARRLGAMAVQVNHPFIPYGYLTSVAGGTAPGGFNPGFDLLEMNAAESGDERVLRQLWTYWNGGHRIYLTAGTDTHDVWKDVSGRVRVYSHVEGSLSAAGFVRALKDGHAYVSYGPLMSASPQFGETLRLRRGGRGSIGIELQSLAGLRSVRLIGGGATAENRQFADHPQTATADFLIEAARAAPWYSLVVEDVNGHKAYSDPIWVDLTEP